MAKESNLKTKAYRIIKNKIICGEISQGMPLLEVQLSQDLKISRTPVREAISLLVKDGLAVYKPGRGCMVRVFTPDDIAELYELREQLELFALRKACDHLAENIRQKMRACCDHFLELFKRVETTAKPDELRQLSMEMYATDTDFHLQLLLNSGNRYVCKVVSDFGIMSSVIMLAAQHEDTSAPILMAAAKFYHHRHQELLSAIEAHDSSLAEQLLREHLRDAGCRLGKYCVTPKDNGKNWIQDVLGTLHSLDAHT